MSVGVGPKIVNTGLVFSYDMNNTKSYKGMPTTNLVTNASVMSGWSAYYRTTAAPTFTTEFGTTGYRLDYQPSWNGIYRSFTLPSAGAYTFSAYYRFWGKSTNNNGATVYMSAFGTGTDTAVGIDTTKIGVWQRLSGTITASGASPSGTFYIISYGGTDNGTTSPDWSSWEVTMPQIEAGSVVSSFVDGSRSNTNSIIDLTGINTITASSLTYASNNTFSFNGSNNYIDLGTNAFNLGITQNGTFCGWISSSSSTAYLVSDWNTTGMTLRMNDLTSADFYVYPNNHRITASYSFSVNTWYHLAGVMSGANMYLYINGVQVGTTTLGESIGSSSSTLKIGTRGDLAGYTSQRASMLQIYNRALTGEEIKQNFNATRGVYGI